MTDEYATYEAVHLWSRWEAGARYGLVNRTRDLGGWILRFEKLGGTVAEVLLTPEECALLRKALTLEGGLASLVTETQCKVTVEILIRDILTHLSLEMVPLDDPREFEVWLSYNLRDSLVRDLARVPTGTGDER